MWMGSGSWLWVVAISLWAVLIWLGVQPYCVTYGLLQSPSRRHKDLGKSVVEDARMLKVSRLQDHRADSVIESSLYRLENYALIYLRLNFCDMTINDNKAIPEHLFDVR